MVKVILFFVITLMLSLTLNVALIVNNIKCFELECKNLNDFDKETLYIEPYNK